MPAARLEICIEIEEAARRLSVTRRVMYRLFDSGQLRSIHIFGARRVVVADLEAFIAQRQAVEEEPS